MENTFNSQDSFSTQNNELSGEGNKFNISFSPKARQFNRNFGSSENSLVKSATSLSKLNENVLNKIILNEFKENRIADVCYKCFVVYSNIKNEVKIFQNSKKGR